MSQVRNMAIAYGQKHSKGDPIMARMLKDAYLSGVKVGGMLTASKASFLLSQVKIALPACDDEVLLRDRINLCSLKTKLIKNEELY